MDLTGVRAVIMSGGAVRHPQWVELLATILGRNVAVAADAHLTVRGAARLAARGMGSDFPDPPPGRSVDPRSDVDVDGPLRAFEAATDRYFDAA
jgi:sugar (pentulose or hexulose) kinase